MSDIEKALAGLRSTEDVPVPLAKLEDAVPELFETHAHTLGKASEQLGIDLKVANDTMVERGSTSAASAEKSASDVGNKNIADVSHAPILELPLDSLMQDGFLVPGIVKGRLTEEYRRVKRPLLKNLRKDIQPENCNVVMVTSSVSGEGKTYTAINLAMSFALERDLTVLLIDGDVIKGSAGKMLGVDSNATGLTDLLAGNVSDIQDAIRPTNIPSLSFLPAGGEHDLANELLSSDVMKHCIKKLADQDSDRIIIIDSPPLLQTNEANIIAEYAGQVVFVVAEGDTPQKMVTQALTHLDKDKYVGILVNKSAPIGKSYAYGYEYGYE